MRFDDQRGLLPATVRLIGGCLKGTLVRTKTTGPGRRREELYIHVDSAAYLLAPQWLEIGWRLWASIGCKKELFLTLPTCDWDWALQLEATYTDSRAMSRNLTQRLRNDDESLMLSITDSAAYWTEHSDRATLPTWAASLQSIPTDWLDDLCRWSSIVSLAYVRSQLRRVAKNPGRGCTLNPQ